MLITGYGDSVYYYDLAEDASYLDHRQGYIEISVVIEGALDLIIYTDEYDVPEDILHTLEDDKDILDWQIHLVDHPHPYFEESDGLSEDFEDICGQFSQGTLWASSEESTVQDAE